MIKYKLFLILDTNTINSKWEKILNSFLLALICLNVIAVIIEPSLVTEQALSALRIFEFVSVMIFSLEYILRVWVSDQYYPELRPGLARLKYAFSAMALIDLVSILPFYLPFLISVDLRVLRSLRLFRLFRLFKANRYLKSLHLVIQVLRRKASELISSIIIVFVLMLISATILFNFEHDAQPQAFKSMFDAFWWSISTLTTVGYGDIYPITVIGKVFSGIIALLGIGIVAIPTGIIASGFSEVVKENELLAQKKQVTAPKAQALACPHCGHAINLHVVDEA